MRLEMAHLAKRMHARIRAACAVDHDFLLGNLPGSVVEGALDRRHTRLELPAMESGAVIGDRQLDVAHVPERLSHALRRKPVQRNAHRMSARRFLAGVSFIQTSRLY